MTPQHEEVQNAWVCYRDTLRRQKEEERRKRKQREEEEIKSLKEALEKSEERGRRIEILIMQQVEAKKKVDSQEDIQIEEHVETRDQVDGEEMVTKIDQMKEIKEEQVSKIEERKGEEEIQGELENDVAVSSLQYEGKMGPTINIMTKLLMTIVKMKIIGRLDQ